MLKRDIPSGRLVLRIGRIQTPTGAAIALFDEGGSPLPGQVSVSLGTSLGEDGQVETLVNVTFQTGSEVDIEMVP